MRNFCYKCGCHGTLNLERENVKHKLHKLCWLDYENITLLVDLDLIFCNNCGNTPMNTEDIKNLDKAIAQSVAIQFLSKIKLDNYDANILDFKNCKLVEKPWSEECFSLWSMIHNKNLDKLRYVNLAADIVFQHRKELSVAEFIEKFQNQL